MKQNKETEEEGKKRGVYMWKEIQRARKKFRRPNYSYYTLSGRTDSALAWHTQGRVFAPRLPQQVLRFVARIYTVQYVELSGYCSL